MKVNDTGDKDLNKWKTFFAQKKKTNTRFISLLKNTDKFFLTVSPPQHIEEPEYPDDGLLEEDFREIAFHDSPKKLEQKSRLVLAILFNVNMQPWKNKYGDKFSEVIEKSLIEGDYEKYGVDFEKVLSLAMKKNYINKDEFMGISLLRGMLIGSRYNENNEKKLKHTVSLNKFKVFLKI